MYLSRLPLLLALGHGALSKQPSAPAPIRAPLRELPWGQINFLHTTDTHGWHGGHLQEPQYSADWGDYISFADHLRRRADDDGSDLLVIDTGDRVEGNGLYDASHPKGEYTYDIVKDQKIDVITSGNHELYLRNTSNMEFERVVPDFKNSYIASNLDIYDPKSGKRKPFAPRFRRFTTKNQGVRVLAMGFLFDFQGNKNNTVVQPVEETMKEQWFQDAIREKNVDLFVVAGHVALRDSEEFDTIYKAIRSARWDTPIVFFGGHTHIRDYRKWDGKAYGIESGRYMETLGFLSISGLTTEKDNGVVAAASPTYQRLYIDNNLFSLHHHSGTNESTFDTGLGRNVSKAIHDARSKLQLDQIFGCAPRDFWLNRAPYPSNSSILTWLEKKVLPDTFSDVKRPSIIITNSGAVRFDIFKGPFTFDTTFLVSPFTSGWRQLKDVPYKAASQVLQLLNNEGSIPLKDIIAFAKGDDRFGQHRLGDFAPPLPPVDPKSLRQDTRNDWNHPEQITLGNNGKNEPLMPGYTTTDDAGKDGDDTIHETIQFYNVPNCIGASIGFSPSAADSIGMEETPEQPEMVDLIYNQFIQDWVILALKYLGENYGQEDTQPVLNGTSMTDVISDWVKAHWKCKE